MNQRARDIWRLVILAVVIGGCLFLALQILESKP